MNVCFQLKYQSKKVFFRFFMSPSYSLRLINGDSIILLLNFHQKRRTLHEDMEVMRFSFWQRRRGKNVAIYHSDFLSIHLSPFICLLLNLLLISVSPVARTIISMSVDRCCSVHDSATVRSRIMLTFKRELIDTLNP